MTTDGIAMGQMMGAFDRRAQEFEAAVRVLERQMHPDRALLQACDDFAIEREDAEELLDRAAELRRHHQ